MMASARTRHLQSLTKISTERDSQLIRLAHNFGMGRMDRRPRMGGCAVTARFAALVAAAALVGGSLASAPGGRRPAGSHGALHQPGLLVLPAGRQAARRSRRPQGRARAVLPVDYWDYLGWKDTLASHDDSARQREYAHSRGDGEVYTPQAVDRRQPGRRRQRPRRGRDGAEAGTERASRCRSTSRQRRCRDRQDRRAAGRPPNRGTIWLVMYDRSVTVPSGAARIPATRSPTATSSASCARSRCGRARR